MLLSSFWAVLSRRRRRRICCCCDYYRGGCCCCLRCWLSPSLPLDVSEREQSEATANYTQTQTYATTLCLPVLIDGSAATRLLSLHRLVASHVVVTALMVV